MVGFDAEDVWELGVAFGRAEAEAHPLPALPRLGVVLDPLGGLAAGALWSLRLGIGRGPDALGV